MYPIEKYQFKTYEQKNSDGTKSIVVVALSTYAGKIVKGVAKCREGDSFNLEAGKRLAAARCDLKVCMKRKNRALQKRSRLAKVAEMLKLDYASASNYYYESLEECVKSLDRLKTIEEELA